MLYNKIIIMDFGIFFQLRTKKFWWMDVIFYFVVSLLVATVLCYIIFLLKNGIQKKEIEKEIIALQSVGTEKQKADERFVIEYQKKISDFGEILKNHEFASQVFYFMQNETGPNVWFENFNLSQKEASVNLSGEADNADAFSRQVAAFEKSEYVKNIKVLNSTLGESSRLDFNIAITLNPKIFTYIADLNPALLSEDEPAVEEISENNPAVANEGSENVLNQEDTNTPEVLPKEPAEQNKFGFGVILAVILLVIAIICASVGAFFIYKKKQKNKQQIQQ